MAKARSLANVTPQTAIAIAAATPAQIKFRRLLSLGVWENGNSTPPYRNTSRTPDSTFDAVPTAYFSPTASMSSSLIRENFPFTDSAC